MRSTDNHAITSDVLDVLGVSQTVNTAISTLQQIHDLITPQRRPKAEEYRKDIGEIISDLKQADTNIRILASNILNETIAEDAGKEVTDENKD